MRKERLGLCGRAAQCMKAGAYKESKFERAAASLALL